MTAPVCRWYELSGAIACARGHGCHRMTVNTCTYPGFEKIFLEPGECLECEHFDAPALPRRLRPLPPRKAVVRDRPRPVGWKGQEYPSCHLACADIEQLHQVAAMCGLRQEWYQERPFPHYDVIGATKLSQVRQLAVLVSRFDLVRVARASQ